MVSICEVLFLLALDDQEGNIIESAAGALESAIAGAILAELALQHRIDLVNGRVVVTDQTPVEHPVLNKAVDAILDTSRARKVRYWINTLTYKKFQEEIGQYLVEIGMLVRNKKRLRLATPLGENSAGLVSARLQMKTRLREIVLVGKPPEFSEKVLLALLYHSRLLKLVFMRGERKTASKRIMKLIENEESRLNTILEEIVAITTRAKV